MRPGIPFLHVPKCPGCAGTGFEVVDRETVDCRACGGSGIARKHFVVDVDDFKKAEDPDDLPAFKRAQTALRNHYIRTALREVYGAYVLEFGPDGFEPTDFLDYVCVALKDEFGFDDPSEVYEHRIKERRSFSKQTQHTWRSPYPDEIKDQLETCRCDVCGKEEKGGYVPHGWWGFPTGWLVSESDATGSVIVCSPECARAFDAREGRL